MKALVAMKFDAPTPIQAKAIPVALEGGDVIGCAQTGTGKTAAFGVPIIARLLKAPDKTALILAPTRELAEQIEGVLRKLTTHCSEIRLALLIGGASMKPQYGALRKSPRIVVATPGRLLDHLERRTVHLREVGIFVLDEADRMLDMGFAPALNQILKEIPRERQTMLFAATLPANILQLASKCMKNPTRVTVGEVSMPIQKIEQSVIETTTAKKKDVLIRELNSRRGSILVFARTRSRTERLARDLVKAGHDATKTHGGRSQAQRRSALAGFKSGQHRILVATDVAARGIDVSNIAHVINFDLPDAPEDYIHRIGRTGRAGANGTALSLITPEDRGGWRDIQRLIAKKVPATVATQR